MYAEKCNPASVVCWGQLDLEDVRLHLVWWLKRQQLIVHLLIHITAASRASALSKQKIRLIRLCRFYRLPTHGCQSALTWCVQSGRHRIVRKDEFPGPEVDSAIRSAGRRAHVKWLLCSSERRENTTQSLKTAEFKEPGGLMDGGGWMRGSDADLHKSFTCCFNECWRETQSLLKWLFDKNMIDLTEFLIVLNSLIKLTNDKMTQSQILDHHHAASRL